MMKITRFDQAFVFMKGYCEAVAVSNPEVKDLQDMLARFEELYDELKEDYKNGNKG